MPRNLSTPAPPKAPWRICAVYRFAPCPDHETLRDRLHELCRTQAIKGTLVLAPEGINGTVAGSSEAIDALVAFLRADERFEGAQIKFASAHEAPFRRLKVRSKPEIVTLGHPVDPTSERGRYVAPKDWDAFTADPDVVTVDVRNDFEVAMGTFEGALDPKTREFRDFPAWAEANLPADRDTPIAMFCTGGIRCEKSTSWLAQQGYRNLHHLEGGILRYLEEVPRTEATKWRGGCFVFDERVGVGFGLEQTDHTVCRSCRMPLDAQDRAHEDYHAEISCPHCAASLRPAARARRHERALQAQRAAERGIAHVAADLDAERARKRRERAEQRRRSLVGKSGAKAS